MIRFLRELFRKPKVRNSHVNGVQRVIAIADQDILWLEVSMHDSLSVHKIKGEQKLCTDYARLCLTEQRSFSPHCLPEISPALIFKHEFDHIERLVDSHQLDNGRALVQAALYLHFIDKLFSE